MELFCRFAGLCCGGLDFFFRFTGLFCGCVGFYLWMCSALGVYEERFQYAISSVKDINVCVHAMYDSLL